MKKILFLILAMMSSVAFAQNITVKGTVTSASDSEPMAGVTVYVDGTSKAVLTDVYGVYEIKGVEKTATLVFKSFSMKDVVMPINGRDIVNVTMEEDLSQIEEVVVIGYGVTKKSDLTSSIATVKSADIEKITSDNVMSSLQGKVAGVSISTAGSPGATPQVIIRGATSVNGADPLYVVDGVPVGTSINFLNQSDIASMEILKDAASTAIYGTRGANGVILITTKKGKNEKVSFNVTTSNGISFLSKPGIADAEEYTLGQQLRYTNDGQTPVWNTPDGSTVDTDWWDECVTPSITQSYNISFSGGTDKIIYSGSVGYYGKTSNYDYGEFERITARFNTEYRFNSIVQVGVDIMPSIQMWDSTPNVFSSIMRMDPTTPVMDDVADWTDNEYDNYSRSYNNQVWNPVATVARQDDTGTSTRLYFTPYINIVPIEGLTLRSQFGYNTTFQRSDSFAPEFYIDNLEHNDVNTASRSFYNTVEWNWTNTATYHKIFNDKHNFTATLGYTMDMSNYYYLSGSSDATPSNLEELRYVSAGTENQQVSGSDENSSLISYLARIMYSYDDRYFLTATYRMDGSSKFSTENQWATFPSVSAAWKLSSESFMDNVDVIDNLKLRAGWGRVGNQNIDNSAFLSLISTSDYAFNNDRVTGTAVSSVGSTDLFWETVEDWGVGFDLGLLNNRLTVTADYFYKESSDMLLEVDNVFLLGYSSMWSNVGSMSSEGVEFAINWADQIGDWSYSIGGNISHTKQTALTLLGGDAPILTGSWNSQYIISNQEGEEISQFWGYVADGLFQNETEVNAHTDEYGNVLQPYAQAGDIRFVDLNNDGVLDDNDKTFIGNPNPDFTYAFNASVAWKNIDFAIEFYGSQGNEIYNTSLSNYSGAEGQNFTAGAVEPAWSGEGTSNYIPRLSVNDLNSNYSTVSSFFVEDGSYLRCKLLQIGYTLPKDLLKCCSLRISLSAQNLFTVTGYSGLDPETAAIGDVTSQGIDWYGYPNATSYLIGLNFNF